MAKSKAQTPGSVLQSFMDEYQLNPNKLGKEIKLNQTSLRGIINGKMKVSVPVALRLAKYFGNAAQYWVDLQIQQEFTDAAKDGELSAILKSISKAKKPAPAPKAPASAAKKSPKAKSPKAAAKAAKETLKSKTAVVVRKPRKAKAPLAEAALPEQPVYQPQLTEQTES
ncbi:MAG: HigA family addiction module antidote protein [Treponema sp.]|jgi:addiction module HigA family antidote|nr:HigA family addiction module antidote protein [Treponema sp.]